MSRSIWKGTISFGLVSVPVELYAGVREHRPHFRLLHAKDKSPIKYTRICQHEGRPVSWDELVKGYEYEKGRFVTVTKEDFETAALEKSRTIDILDFVKAVEIDARFYQGAYHVLPGAGADRPYALLREALRETGRVGIGKFILHETQRLAALSVAGDALILNILRFADEVVDFSEARLPATTSIRARELTLAKSLIESLADAWSPEKYTDEYQANLVRILEAKLKGKKPALRGAAQPRDAAVIDLMERLQQSLAAGGAKAGKAKSAARSKAGAHRRKATKRAAARPSLQRRAS